MIDFVAIRHHHGQIWRLTSVKIVRSAAIGHEPETLNQIQHVIDIIF